MINVIKYIFDVISININKIKTENKDEVSFIYIFDSSPSEDNELLNEVILRKSSNNKLVQSKEKLPANPNTIPVRQNTMPSPIPIEPSVNFDNKIRAIPKSTPASENKSGISNCFPAINVEICL